MSTLTFNRREFMKSGTALVIGFAMPGFSRNGNLIYAQNKERPQVNPLNAWVRIAKDNSVTLILAKSEMGQGVTTSLPMILAEELDVPWSSVKVEQALTDPTVYEHGTGGSGSVADSYLPLRQAGAAARQMLIAAAAQIWEASPETCHVKEGAVYHGARTRKLTYGELVETAVKMPIPDLKTVQLKNSNTFDLIGKSLPRLDIPGKVNGTAVFGIDVRVPGMLRAVIARCPYYGGKVKSYDAAKAKAIPGVVQVVEVAEVRSSHSKNGIAVVAQNTWAAMKGRDALVVEWEGASADESSDALSKRLVGASEPPGKTIRNEGDLDAAFASAAKKIDAVYELPFLAHATMEPMNCTADVRADSAEIWAPTQGPDWILAVVGKAIGLNPKSIKVHTTLMGGGFGRRYQTDYAVEAALVSKAVGKPVQVVWTREDDMAHDFYRPACCHRLSAGFDGSGKPAAWKHHICSTSIRAFWGGNDPAQQEVTGAAEVPYSIPSIRVEYAPVASNVPRAWWRSVENSFNGFAVESFIDEVATEMKKDPVALRMELLAGDRKIPNIMWKTATPLDTARLRAVLQEATARAGWGKPLPKGHACGAACFYSFDTYVAQVAEVSVDNGEVKVHRVVCAVDCGRVINPEGVKAQMESAIIYGLTAALFGEITIKDGAVQQSNFHDYQMARIGDAPKMEIYLIPSTADPKGVGEPGVPPLAPAVTNAVFALTGRRVRSLPIKISS